ncbi:NADAR domain-containing protein [Bradyrhizobium sp. 930_D9_N1_4]|uniref:NADAR domain-containing protein n=1 Tax=Bradyrhizobium sp. 930_D9_N1_4 TaxID=3240374 RepID=UPI003F8C877C
MTIAPAVSVFDPEGPLALLSNYSDSPFLADGELWRTVEHFFQASKFVSPQRRAQIQAASTPQDAKSIAWDSFDVESLPDWSKRRIKVMTSALHAKAACNSIFSRMLWESWPWPIIEDSATDQIWGIGAAGNGSNLLGEALMAVRREIVGVPEIIQGSLFGRPAHLSLSTYRLLRWSSYHVKASHHGTVGDLKAGKLASVSVDRVMESKLVGVGCVVGNTFSRRQISLSDTIRELTPLNPDWETRTLAHAVYSARSAAFTEKYATYSWGEDIRSAFPDWGDRFLSIFGERLRGDGRVAVLGGGVGDEAAHLWCKLDERVTFIDVSRELVDLAVLQSPKAQGVVGDAETLASVPDESFAGYVSLRAYQSYLFDVRSALLTARRVLKPGGVLILSVADGYLDRDDRPVRGRITHSGGVDLSAAALDLLRIICALEEYDFSIDDTVNLGGELLIGASKRAR